MSSAAGWESAHAIGQADESSHEHRKPVFPVKNSVFVARIRPLSYFSLTLGNNSRCNGEIGNTGSIKENKALLAGEFLQSESDRGYTVYICRIR